MKFVVKEDFVYRLSLVWHGLMHIYLFQPGAFTKYSKNEEERGGVSRSINIYAVLIPLFQLRTQISMIDHDDEVPLCYSPSPAMSSFQLFLSRRSSSLQPQHQSLCCFMQSRGANLCITHIYAHAQRN